jgi:hypothetical protein
MRSHFAFTRSGFAFMRSGFAFMRSNFAFMRCDNALIPFVYVFSWIEDRTPAFGDQRVMQPRDLDVVAHEMGTF